MTQQNVEQNRQTVLCFGDSNTFGQRPDGPGRFDENVRWTRQLQQMVAEQFYVIEEGLGNRTIDREHPDTTKPTKNGWVYFRPCVGSHQPDILIVTLGTNDCQVPYKKTAQTIAESLEKYVTFAKESNISRILLVAPVPIDAAQLIDPATGFSDRGTFSNDSVKKSLEYPKKLKEMSEVWGVEYLNASDYAELGEDGLHWDEASQGRFARAVAEWLRSR